MSRRLEGKVAIVTGSNSGIGKGIAIAYAAEGARVVCASRSPTSSYAADIDEVATHDLINQNRGEAVFCKLVLTNADSRKQLVEEVVKRFGRIDILVNVAGNAYDMKSGKSFWDLHDEDIDQTIDLNLTSTLKLTRDVLKHMVAQEPDRLGERGRIISIGSVFGARGFSNTAVYSATKAGLVGATRSLAVECAPHRILVNVINPGTVVTGMTSGLPEPVESCLEQKALLGFGSTDDTAGAAVFLASAEAKWITGQDLFVDGGYTIS